MDLRNKTLVRQIVILLLFSYVFVLYGIGGYSLKEPDEGRYAEIPREMVASGDYTVPRLNDVRYFEKPPFLYWATALSYKLFGVSEWSFRFPNALAAVLCVFSLFFFVRRWTDEQAAFLASLVLLSSLGFFSMARIVTTDMVLTLWLFLSLLSFYGYYRENKAPFIYGFYASMALATLTKGPVAPVLLGATIFLFLLTEKNIAFVKNMKLFRGSLLFLAIAAPWFVIISLKEKEFFNFFFVDQHILRFVSTKHKRSGPIYYFIPVLLGGMLPWSLFIPRAVSLTWKRPECRLFLIWSALVFIFFSVSGSKLPPYILPIFPTLSMIIGVLFHEKKGSQFSRPVETVIYMVLMAVVAFSCLLYLNKDFTAYIETISTDAPGIMKDLRYFSLWVSLSSAISLTLLFFRRFRQPGRLFLMLTLFSLSLIIAIIVHTGVIDRVNTAKEIAVAIGKEKARPDLIVNYSSLDLTLPFYLRQPVVIASYKGELAMGSKYEDAQKIFMSEEDFSRLIASQKKVLFVTKQKRIEHLKERFPGRINTRMCQNDRCLIANY